MRGAAQTQSAGAGLALTASGMVKILTLKEFTLKVGIARFFCL
jgi:hypothetical protein